MTKFNKEITKEIINLHKKGLPLKTCAEAVGIDRKTLYRWREKGENAKTGKYREFYLNMMKARVSFVEFHVKKISESKDWRASQFLLQVTDPETYILTDKMKIETEQEIDYPVFDEDLFNELLDEYEDRKREKKMLQ